MSIPESLLKNIETKLHIQAGSLLVCGEISGGDINQAFELKSSHQHFFLKLNSASLVAMFAAEAHSLQALNATNTIRCPETIIFGGDDLYAYLLMEYLPLNHCGSSEKLGSALANMHQHSDSRYGWKENNYIGKSLQLNTDADNWSEFWLQNRLLPQLDLATKTGANKKLANLREKLVQATGQLLDQHHPKPSLLHGDLWSGNKAWLKSGEPVIYDPACYYGDRETDIAMTELFGGYGRDFYQAYNNVWPLDKRYALRKPLYNLYHMLNHLNLFGSGYLSSCLALANDTISNSTILRY